MTNSIRRQATLLFLLLATAATAQSAPQHYVVTAPVADMYRSASIGADVVSQTIFGSDVVALETHRRWIKVHSSDDYTGWVRHADLRKQKPEGLYGKGATAAVVSSLFASVYREPNVEKHRPVITIPFESRLEVTGEVTNEDGRWFSVRLPDGSGAWAQSGDVTFDSAPLSIEQSIALARRFVGIPYRWGGTSSFGFDCSGFTQMLMRGRGINMPRDTRPQAKWDGLAPVERAGLQPGDLLFFGKSAEKISHTAMYIGNGEIIHATRHDHPVVQISRLDDEPWTTLFVAARRVK